ncbi:MAG: phosphoribosylaminoimidazolesuccinocarboxamide synthase, partial [Betaproteobacteria bacterium]
IDFATCEKIIGAARATEVRDTAIRLYTEAADYALTKGIIIADTKFEFGVDAAGALHLIDEVLTPDSSRFWPLDSYQVGASPESFDKQYIRNWLDAIGFNRKPPAPQVPAEIAQKTSDKYREALVRLTG